LILLSFIGFFNSLVNNDAGVISRILDVEKNGLLIRVLKDLEMYQPVNKYAFDNDAFSCLVTLMARLSVTDEGKNAVRKLNSDVYENCIKGRFQASEEYMMGRRVLPNVTLDTEALYELI
jgi:hypothetical protein